MEKLSLEDLKKPDWSQERYASLDQDLKSVYKQAIREIGTMWRVDMFLEQVRVETRSYGFDQAYQLVCEDAFNRYGLTKKPQFIKGLKSLVSSYLHFAKSLATSQQQLIEDASSQVSDTLQQPQTHFQYENGTAVEHTNNPSGAPVWVNEEGDVLPGAHYNPHP